MGTYFTPGTNRAGIVSQIIRESAGAIEAHTLVGNHLWTLYATSVDGMPIKLVTLFKLENGGRSGWGYKPMDETMGPYAADCPLEYVRATEPFAPMGYAREFRERVYKFHGVAPPAAGGLADRYHVYTANMRALGQHVKSFDEWLAS